jgi:beta-glucanase (GH16 family)
LGNSFSSVGWPKCGEIDIMEHINTNEKIHGTIHWDANGYATYGGDTTLNDVNQYHDYSIEWDQFGIRWFVDGVQYHSANTANNINSTDEFHEEFFLILNMAIGGNWPGNPASNFVSDTLFIDYVRVYEWGFPNSTESLEKEIEASLFPNPLLQGQSLNIHLKNSRKHSITIYNTLGVPMYHKHNLSKQHSISSSQLVAGVYYAIIQDEQQNFIRKKLLIQ